MLSIVYVYLLFVMYSVGWIYFSWEDLVKDFYNLKLFKVDFHILMRLLYYIVSYLLPLIVYLLLY